MDELIRKLENRQPVQIGETTLERPVLFDRSDQGDLIVIDEGEVQAVESEVYVFDADGQRIFHKTVPSAGAACLMDEEGRFACFATSKPDDRVYFVDCGEEEVTWSRANHKNRTAPEKRAAITDLEQEDDSISVYTGDIPEYRLDLDGNLPEAFRNEQEQFESVDEDPESGLAFLKDYLSSGDRTKMARALVEIEVRLDQEPMREHIGELVPVLAGALKQEQLHTVDLTESSVSAVTRKLVSVGKRILYEAGRIDKELLEPYLDLIREHLDQQPAEAIQSDLQQLEQIVPNWVREQRREVDPDEEPSPNEALIQHLQEQEDLDEDTKEKAIQKLREQERKRSGCGGCLTSTALMLLAGTIVTTGLILSL